MKVLRRAIVACALPLTSASLSTSTALAQTQQVTFTRDIAPIVFAKCAMCHREGEAAPFPLLTYEDVESHAQQIAEVTASRFMPPWLPEPGHGEFLGERRLAEEEIQLFQAWAGAGGPQGDPRDLPPTPQFTDGWQLGEPDLVVTMPNPYTLPEEGLDVYRNFVIPVAVDKPQWIRAMELRPQNRLPIHHAFMLIDSTNRSRRHDDEDSEPGFEGMETKGAYSPGDQFISWQPGKMFRAVDRDIAWRLFPGTDLVLQLHMQPTGKPEEIQASVGLYFAEGPGTVQAQKLVLQSTDIDIPAGASNYRIQEQYRLPVDVDVLAVLPHAHYLCKRMEAFARLPDGTQKWLILIKDWDFNWQGDYHYKDPVFLPAGSVVTMHYTYDNSKDNPRNPNQPPKRVTYGLNSTDEMGEFWFQVVTRHPADRAYLQRDFGRLMLTRQMQRRRDILQNDPEDADARLDLAKILLGLGRVGEAEAHLSRTVELIPESADAHYYYGHALLRQGRIEEAEKELHSALNIHAELFDAVHDLGLLYLQTRDYPQAEAFFLRATEINAYDAVTCSNLALAMLHQKKVAEAIPHLEHAIELNPSDDTSRQRLEVARKVLAAKEAGQPTSPIP